MIYTPTQEVCAFYDLCNILRHILVTYYHHMKVGGVLSTQSSPTRTCMFNSYKHFSGVCVITNYLHPPTQGFDLLLKCISAYVLCTSYLHMKEGGSISLPLPYLLVCLIAPNSFFGGGVCNNTLFTPPTFWSPDKSHHQLTN